MIQLTVLCSAHIRDHTMYINVHMQFVASLLALEHVLGGALSGNTLGTEQSRHAVGSSIFVQELQVLSQTRNV